MRSTSSSCNTPMSRVTGSDVTGLVTWHTEQAKQVGCQTLVCPAREADMQMSPPTIESPHCPENCYQNLIWPSTISTCSHVAGLWRVTGICLTVPRPRASLFLWAENSLSSFFSSSLKLLQYLQKWRCYVVTRPLTISLPDFIIVGWELLQQLLDTIFLSHWVDVGDLVIGQGREVKVNLHREVWIFTSWSESFSI